MGRRHQKTIAKVTINEKNTAYFWNKARGNKNVSSCQRTENSQGA